MLRQKCVHYTIEIEKLSNIIILAVPNWMQTSDANITETKNIIQGKMLLIGNFLSFITKLCVRFLSLKN